VGSVRGLNNHELAAATLVLTLMRRRNGPAPRGGWGQARMSRRLADPYARAVNASQSNSHKSGDAVKLTTWIIVAAVAPIAIVIGGIGATLRSFGGDDPQPFIGLAFLGVAMSLGAGVFAIVLGGRAWAAVLVALPGLSVILGYLVGLPVISLAVFASPITIWIGVAAVLRAMDQRAADPSDESEAIEE